MNMDRHNLDWRLPLLPQATEWLARDWQGPGPLDLRGTWIVVATRGTERKIRARLAAKAATRQRAVLPPRFLTPEDLFSKGGNGGPIPNANGWEMGLAWRAVLERLDLGEYKALFPVEPPERDWSWTWSTAETVQRVRRRLADGGLSLAMILNRCDRGEPDYDRWSALASLVNRYEDQLAAWGRRDDETAKLIHSQTAEVPTGLTRLILLANPNPSPLAIQLLSRWAEQGLPMTVVTYGPEEAGGETRFDEWGRPLAEARWLEEWPDHEQRVRLAEEPAEEARLIVELLENLPFSRRPALGVVDPEVMESVVRLANANNMPIYDPRGRTVDRECGWQWLEHYGALVADGSLAAAVRFFKHPAVAESPGRMAGAPQPWRVDALHEELDLMVQEHMPVWWDAIGQWTEREPVRYRHLSQAARWLDGHLQSARQDPLEKSLPTLLDDLLAGQSAAGGREAWERQMEVVEQICQVAAERTPLVVERARTFQEAWPVMRRLTADQTLFSEKSSEAVELNGWLELLWEERPHLMVAGLNEGIVPRALHADPFLPAGTAKRLGLPGPEREMARDRYLLAALRASRTGESGRLDVLLAQRTARGDPLIPSRLVLETNDGLELARRVNRLCRALPVGASPPARRLGWRLEPRLGEPVKSISVTGFRIWLENPLRYYFERVLGMQEVEAESTEMDARVFGTLCHAVLERLSKPVSETGLPAESVDEERIGECFQKWLEEEISKRFGRRISPLLHIQLESVRQRLAWAAKVEAQSRQEGWRTWQTEFDLSDFQLSVGPLLLRGRVDRIDYHEAGGRFRVLDYKTSDKAKTATESHYKGWKRGKKNLVCPEAGFAMAGAAGKEPVWFRWVDLQLPLYAWALDQLGAKLAWPAPLSLERLEIGYFNLPRAVTETGLALWNDFDGKWLTPAIQCAEAVAREVAGGRFWDDSGDAFWRGRPGADNPYGRLLSDPIEEAIRLEGLSGQGTL